MKPARAVAALLLAGCITGTPVTNDTVVPGGGFEAVRGEARLIVRTFIPEGEQARREVSGARCRLESSLFETAFATPTRLVVPNFGPQSPELSVTCTAGDLAGTGRVRILTRWQHPPGYGPDPYRSPWRDPIGRPGLDGWGWRSSAFPISNYPDLDILLR